MATYKKKPQEIEAFQLDEVTRRSNADWPDWLHKAWNNGPGEGGVWPDPAGELGSPKLACGTPQGVQPIGVGDYVIRYSWGELQVYKQDVFDATFERVKP